MLESKKFSMAWISSPGNIFFAGEHAVVYGKPAIVASVERRTRVRVVPREDDMVIVNSRELGIAEMRVNGEGKRGPKELEVILDFIDSLITKSLMARGFEVYIESEIPIESGMSSSTAVFSAILEALNNYLELGIPREDYFSIIHPFQEIVHGGKASGSEIFSSVFGGFHWLEKREGKLVGEKIRELEIPVVIGNTMVRAPTKLTVGYHVPSLMDRYPELVNRAWEDIEAITREMRRAIEKEDLERLGGLMNENHRILRDLKLSHPKLEDCIEEALKAGALGAKLSGGGWGGIMFAICYPEDQEKIAEAVQKTRAEVIKTRIGGEGLRKEEN